MPFPKRSRFVYLVCVAIVVVTLLQIALAMSLADRGERLLVLLTIPYVVGWSALVIASVALVGLVAFNATLSRNYAVVLNIAIGFAAASVLLLVAHTFRVVAATGLLVFWGLLLGLQLRTRISAFSAGARSAAIRASIWCVPVLVLAIASLGATRAQTEIPWSSILLVAGGVLVASAAIGALEGAERVV